MKVCNEEVNMHLLVKIKESTVPCVGCVSRKCIFRDEVMLTTAKKI